MENKKKTACPNPAVRAVLFDMDGVITDTEKYYCECWPKSFRAFGYTEFTPEDALLKRSLNHADTEIWCKQRFGADIPLDEIRAYNNACVDALIEKYGISVKPGILELLSYLKKTGIKSAVVTATKYERALSRLSRAALPDTPQQTVRIPLHESFDRIISASMVKRGKPHPDVYLYACEQIGELPNNCIALEDSPNGICAAYSAGCRTIMIPDLTQPTEDLLPMLFTAASSAADVIAIIERLNASIVL